MLSLNIKNRSISGYEMPHFGAPKTKYNLLVVWFWSVFLLFDELHFSYTQCHTLKYSSGFISKEIVMVMSFLLLLHLAHSGTHDTARTAPLTATATGPWWDMADSFQPKMLLRGLGARSMHEVQGAFLSPYPASSVMGSSISRGTFAWQKNVSRGKIELLPQI